MVRADWQSELFPNPLRHGHNLGSRIQNASNRVPGLTNLDFDCSKWQTVVSDDETIVVPMHLVTKVVADTRRVET